MPKYKTKPRVVDAFEWKGSVAHPDVPVWFLKALDDDQAYLASKGAICLTCDDDVQTGDDGEGDDIVVAGEYVVLGLRGGLASYSAEDFAAMFERIDE